MTASTHTTTNPNFYLLENLKNTFTSQNYLKNTFSTYRNNRNKRGRCIGNFQNSILFSYIIADISVWDIDVNVWNLFFF